MIHNKKKGKYENRLKKLLKKHPLKPWDDAINEIAEDNHRDIDKS
jgi:hypothetical protein